MKKSRNSLTLVILGLTLVLTGCAADRDINSAMVLDSPGMGTEAGRVTVVMEQADPLARDWYVALCRGRLAREAESRGKAGFVVLTQELGDRRLRMEALLVDEAGAWGNRFQDAERVLGDIAAMEDRFRVLGMVTGILALGLVVLVLLSIPHHRAPHAQARLSSSVHRSQP